MTSGHGHSERVGVAVTAPHRKGWAGGAPPRVAVGHWGLPRAMPVIPGPTPQVAHLDGERGEWTTLLTLPLTLDQRAGQSKLRPWTRGFHLKPHEPPT